MHILTSPDPRWCDELAKLQQAPWPRPLTHDELIEVNDKLMTSNAQAPAIMQYFGPIARRDRDRR